MAACTSLPPGPVAAEKPHGLTIHGETRQDPYFWMKEREDPAVIAHLKAENAYVDEVLKEQKPLQDELYRELRARTKENDSSYPYQRGEYFYYQRFEAGQEYPIYARRRGSMAAEEEILLDVNEKAKGHEYFSVPFPDISPDHKKMIYAVDSVGRRFYHLHVVEIATGKVLGQIPNVTGAAEWANDSQTFFYTKQHPETLRSQYAFRHRLGQEADELVFEEKDETFNLSVAKSRTNGYIFLASGATLSSEWRFLSADKPSGKFEVFLPRESKHEYEVMDGGDGFFYVLSNWQATNFRLLKAPARATAKEKWEEVIPHNPNVFLEAVAFFRSHYALHERKAGLTQLRVVDRASGVSRELEMPDPSYVIGGAENPEFGAGFYRYTYQSLNQPPSVYDYEFTSRKSELRKQKEVPNFDPSLYASERIWAPAADGTRIPVSLVYKKGTQRDGRSPLLQYGYGSYGISMEPWFSVDHFSLVDRGFVYAIAHVRGGSEMGRPWYDSGKLLQKRNTFTDFIAVTEHLTKLGYADPRRVYAEGGSAGGLLMGAVINLRPDLYAGVHAAVPFVDVITTMLDDSIPLTTGEYDEWGNPNQAEFYRYMLSYSPYDNVTAQAYPAVLITSGLHDSQVQYWEPTKWAAKLRKLSTSGQPVLLRTEMDAGHGGSSGRFEAMKETAEEMSFFLWADKRLR